MSKTYTDYYSKTALTVSEAFIDVKTGNNVAVSSKVKEQIEYHAKNQTLNHLVLSALHSYLHPKTASSSNEIILAEIAELKNLISGSYISPNHAAIQKAQANYKIEKANLNLDEVVDVLEAFGG